MAWVSAIFVLSGFSALLYQVVWQRSLFAIFGINVEAVTVIVTAFMLGLGVGSILGGEVSKNPRRPALLLFSLVELGIGLFGFLSLPLFHWVGGFTLGLSSLQTFAVTFLLVLFPTTLMGSTLPLLVGHAVRASRNVGKAVGLLYFVNTLGSGVAAILSVFILMGALGQTRTVYVAACINLTVSALAWWQHRKSVAVAR
jgi:predicted membrane-bound spermidine synthase